MFIKNKIRLKKTTKIFLFLLGVGIFKKYVSSYGIQCFTWKDEGADKAFLEYMNFIKKCTIKSQLEIEIKK